MENEAKKYNLKLLIVGFMWALLLVSVVTYFVVKQKETAQLSIFEDIQRIQADMEGFGLSGTVQFGKEKEFKGLIGGLEKGEVYKVYVVSIDNKDLKGEQVKNEFYVVND